MEEIVRKKEIPALSKEVKIQSASRGALPGLELDDISEAGIEDIVEKVRSGAYSSIMMSPDEYGEKGYFTLESSLDLIFLQIWDEDSETAWACFDPDYLDSDEEAPIEASDSQSVFPMKCTMKDRSLAARCVEWYAYTLEPYPSMEWLKMTW